ncbi:hypothetical protein COLO4_02252 [Corchorus olitorius]|uniref:Uncharacterized protein n=1 Tax=Corchorus olitorius TaxID=93759 RepID=A0A1R3L1G6_9ROSI|nr:hypothetical protein COLO4_02252 [Corchorus olitorius]
MLNIVHGLVYWLYGKVHLPQDSEELLYLQRAYALPKGVVDAIHSTLFGIPVEESDFPEYHASGFAIILTCLSVDDMNVPFSRFLAL